jgi:hypothetical protein
MSDPINHHYLPIFYLSNWCDSNGKVTRFYRPHDKVVASRIAPSNTGYEPFLYTHHGVKPDRQQAIEREYMSPWVDDPGSRALRLFMEGASEKFTEKIKSDWTRFLMAMRLRDPHSLREITASAKEVLKKTLSVPDDPEYLAVKDESDPATLYEWVEENAPHVIENVGKTFLPGIIDHERIGNHMINMRWCTFDVGSGGIPLLTGDRPLIATAGLSDPNCVVALPLSPRLLFIATNSDNTETRLRAAGVRKLAKATNINILGQAMKHVYGDSSRQLVFVQNRLRRR